MKLRKFLSVVLATGILFSSSVVSATSTRAQVSQFILNSNTWTLDGQSKTMDAPPRMINQRVYLPIRYAATALGIDENDIKWDNKTATVTINDNGKTVVIKEGSSYLTVDGKVTSMDGKVVSLNGRVYLPLSQVAKAFDGVELNWNSTLKTITTTRQVNDAIGKSDKEILEEAGFSLEKFGSIIYYAMPRAYYAKFDEHHGLISIDNGPHVMRNLHIYSCGKGKLIIEDIGNRCVIKPDSRIALETNMRNWEWRIEDYTILENDSAYMLVKTKDYNEMDCYPVRVLDKNSTQAYSVYYRNVEEFRCWDKYTWRAFIRTLAF